MDAHPGAASVAAQLLAFYREPALQRPPYLHRETPMPEGHVVLRLALGRFPHGWLRDLPARDREEVRTAALAFLRQVCLWDRATHYQVLCLEPDAAREAIRENYHLLIALIHPDRQDAAVAGWPPGCAQRVNQAHETLGDPAQRAQYDAGLRHAGEGMGPDSIRAAHPPALGAARNRRRARSSPAILAKRFVVVSGVIAALFIVQAWWVGDVAPQYSLLARSIPASGRWIGDMLPDPPRFLTAGVPAFDPGARLEPIKEPRRVAAFGSWIPVQESPRESSTGAPGVLVRAEAALSRAAPPADPPATPAAVAPTTPTVAPAEPALRLAQAGAPAPTAGPTRDQIESLVALLVGYYDAGDADRLVDLYDPAQLGWFGGSRMRMPYADFFGATRDRRLRMERLTWQSAGGSALARGEATVTADYRDGRPRLERRVPVELDIGLRDGHARITRLVLFPVAQ